MHLAVESLVDAARLEVRNESSELVDLCLWAANDYAAKYRRDWVYDFMYDPAWQEKNRREIAWRRNVHGVGF